jgi:hypothetical protein
MGRKCGFAIKKYKVEAIMSAPHAENIKGAESIRRAMKPTAKAPAGANPLMRSE